jgi:phage protein U
MFAQLDSIIFERLFSPSTWDTEAEWNWVDLPRIGVKPASQAISVGLKTHSLALKLEATFCDVPGSLVKFLDIGDHMVAVPYFLGNGDFVSMVTFRKMSVTRSMFRPDGTLEAVEITLEMSEYVETEAKKGSAMWS